MGSAEYRWMLRDIADRMTELIMERFSASGTIFAPTAKGDAATLYRSVHEKIFSLPDDTIVYPGHDYQQRRVSSVAQERERNPRLGAGRSVEEFIAIMSELHLPRPNKMDVAVPANLACGEISDRTVAT